MMELNTLMSERVIDHLKWMDGLSNGMFLQGKDLREKSASDQVVLSLREITDGTQQISIAIRQTGEVTKYLTDLSERLLGISESFKLAQTEEIRHDSTGSLPLMAENM